MMVLLTKLGKTGSKVTVGIQDLRIDRGEVVMKLLVAHPGKSFYRQMEMKCITLTKLNI